MESCTAEPGGGVIALLTRRCQIVLEASPRATTIDSAEPAYPDREFGSVGPPAPGVALASQLSTREHRRPRPVTGGQSRADLGLSGFLLPTVSETRPSAVSSPLPPDPVPNPPLEHPVPAKPTASGTTANTGRANLAMLATRAIWVIQRIRT